ncbi:MAG: flippase [Balneolaceae bacterium]
MRKHTTGKLITNAFYSILSKLIPIIISIICIPLIIDKLGEERFGVLTIAWVFIGYFNLFDLGIGKALTKMIAERVGEKESEIPRLFSTATLITFYLGVIGGIIFLLLSKPVVLHVLNIDAALAEEVVSALVFLSIGLPFTIMVNSLKGALEAFQEFKAITNVQILFGILTYVGLIVIIQFTVDISALIIYLSFLKICLAFIFLYLCIKIIGLDKDSFGFERNYFIPLISFGGWVTVSNVVGPIMVALDRLVIGAKETMAAVAYYSTPNEVVLRLGILPTAIVLVLFPVFSQNSESEDARNNKIYESSFSLMLCASAIICFFLIAFAKELLAVWINPEFAQNAFRVLQIISIGALYNFLARIPFTVIQGKGRPDITAKFHIVELPVYLVALFYLIQQYGVNGAAIAVSARMTLDFVLLHFYAVKKYSFSPNIIALVLGSVLPLLIAFLISGMSIDLLTKLSLTFISIGTLLIYFWMFAFENDLKSYLKKTFNQKVSAWFRV